MRWYIDGTFKLVKEPFHQLLSINGFIQSNGEVIQVPLCFIVMSRRTQRDYQAVFRQIVRIVGTTKVQEVVSDFEKAIIKSIKIVFHNVRFYGCAFHFCQALFRRLKKLGLSIDYNANKTLRFLCRQLICLN